MPLVTAAPSTRGRRPPSTTGHEALTHDHSGAIGTWTKGELPPGQVPRQLAPLFKMLHESVERYARLEG